MGLRWIGGWCWIVARAPGSELPTYAWQQRRYWLSSRSEGDAGALGLSAAEHPLLGAMVASVDGEGRCSPGGCRWSRMAGWLIMW